MMVVSLKGIAQLQQVILVVSHKEHIHLQVVTMVLLLKVAGSLIPL